MKIGFVGLGIMGKPMAKNLIKDGYEVICYDFNQSNMDEVAAAGASTAKNSQELANQSDIVILCYRILRMWKPHCFQKKG